MNFCCTFYHTVNNQIRLSDPEGVQRGRWGSYKAVVAFANIFIAYLFARARLSSPQPMLRLSPIEYS